MSDKPTAATTISPETKAAIEAYLDARNKILKDELSERLATATAALEAKLAEAVGPCVKVGESVALKSANGQYVCAQDGGPKKTGEVFEFQSREAVGPHELYVITK